MSRCVGVPVSWLRLERFHLGELAGSERDSVARHLDECEACAACLRSIEEDRRELPPLPGRRPRVSWLRRGAAVGGALALAAALVLGIGRRPSVPRSDLGARTKGSEVALTLVRESEGALVEAGGAYRDGDRFKALVTCPSGMQASFDLVVFERGEPSFPLEPRGTLPCGNDVALPGAFRLTGAEPMTVCLVWSDAGPVDRAATRLGPDALGTAVCVDLAPAP